MGRWRGLRSERDEHRGRRRGDRARRLPVCAQPRLGRQPSHAAHQPDGVRLPLTGRSQLVGPRIVSPAARPRPARPAMAGGRSAPPGGRGRAEQRGSRRVRDLALGRPRRHVRRPLPGDRHPEPRRGAGAGQPAAVRPHPGGPHVHALRHAGSLGGGQPERRGLSTLRVSAHPAVAGQLERRRAHVEQPPRAGLCGAGRRPARRHPRAPSGGHGDRRRRPPVRRLLGPSRRRHPDGGVPDPLRRPRRQLVGAGSGPRANQVKRDAGAGGDTRRRHGLSVLVWLGEPRLHELRRALGRDGRHGIGAAGAQAALYGESGQWRRAGARGWHRHRRERGRTARRRLEPA